MGSPTRDTHYLQLMYTYAPAWGFGGPSRIMYDYAKWMVRQGSGASVIAGDIHHDYSGNLVRDETLDGIRIRRVRVYLRHLVRRSLNCVTPAMLLIAIRRVFVVGKVCVVHVAELRSPVFLYAAILRRLFPRRIILVHSAFGMLHEKRNRMRDVFDPVLMGYLLRSVDVGLAQNHHEVSAYENYCRRYRATGMRVELLPLHTSGPRSNSLVAGLVGVEARGRLRDRYGVSRHALVGIFLGRLHAEKGILRTIDAFLEFARSASGDTLLLVVGRDDGYQDVIRRHIFELGVEDQVRIVNDVYEDRFDYYSLADVFLGFPTIFEETMLASVEALSCGTPVIVSREADLPFVEEGGAGFVIDFSIKAAASCLVEIAASPEEYRARAHAVAADYFTESSACSRFQSIIEAAAQKRLAGVS